MDQLHSQVGTLLLLKIKPIGICININTNEKIAMVWCKNVYHCDSFDLNLIHIDNIKKRKIIMCFEQVVSRFMRKIICRLRLNEVSRQ